MARAKYNKSVEVAGSGSINDDRITACSFHTLTNHGPDDATFTAVMKGGNKQIITLTAGDEPAPHGPLACEGWSVTSPGTATVAISGF